MLISFLQNWEMAHTVWACFGTAFLAIGVVLFTVVYDSKKKSVTKLLAVMQAAKNAAGAPTEAEAEVADVLERSPKGTIGELVGFLIGAVGLAIDVAVIVCVIYDIDLSKAQTTFEALKVEKTGVETKLASAETDKTKAIEAAKTAETTAQKQVEAAKVKAEKLVEAAKAPPGAVPAPIAKFDAATKKLTLASDPPDSTWFVQVAYKGGAPKAQGFVPAQVKDHEFKEGIPELISWYRQNGGRVEIGNVGTVEFVPEKKMKDVD